jgi:hypothetical protein
MSNFPNYGRCDYDRLRCAPRTSGLLAITTIGVGISIARGLNVGSAKSLRWSRADRRPSSIAKLGSATQLLSPYMHNVYPMPPSALRIKSHIQDTEHVHHADIRVKQRTMRHATASCWNVRLHVPPYCHQSHLLTHNMNETRCLHPAVLSQIKRVAGIHA